MSPAAARVLRASAAAVAALLWGCATRAPLPPLQSPFTPTPDAEFRARPPEPWSIEPNPSTSGLERVRLQNGLEVFYVARPGLPLVSLLYVSRAARDGEAGVSSMLPALTGEALIESTYGPEHEVLLGVRVGGVRPTVSVSRSGTQIGLLVPSRGFATAFEVLARVVQQPAFDSESVERIRSRLFERVVEDSRSFSGVVAPLAMRALLGDRDPWAVGSRDLAESLRTQMRGDLIDYHLSRYRPSQSALIVVGDVPAGQVRELARKHFGEWDPREPGPLRGVQSVYARTQGGLQRSAERQVFALASSGEQSTVLIPLRAVPSGHPDRTAIELLVRVLAGGFQSRAQVALRHSGGLTYGVEAAILGNAERAFLFILTSVDRRELRNGVRRLEREIERLRAEPVSESELAAARSAYLGGAGVETTDGLAGALAALYLEYGRGIDELPDFQKLVQAVSAADVLRVAREYLDPRADLVVIGDIESTRDQLEALGDVQYLSVGK